MHFKRVFLAAALAVVGFSGAASAEGGSSSSAAPCEDACCFKQSVVDGKTKFECTPNWCQQSCELVYPKGQDGKPDYNKKPTCGCQAPPPPPPSDPGNSECGSKTSAAQCGGNCTQTDGKTGQCLWVKDKSKPKEKGKGKDKDKDAYKCECTLNPCFQLGVGRCGGPCTGEATGESGTCKVKSITAFDKRCGCDNGRDVVDTISKGFSSSVSSLFK